MKMPQEITTYTVICEKMPTPDIYFNTYDEAVNYAKILQPSYRPYYIIERTESFKICGIVNENNNEMNIGDRVKFRTMGGWYNSGIIRDINEDSYLIEVDELGSKPPKDVYIPLPYYVRILSCEIVNDNREGEGENG